MEKYTSEVLAGMSHEELENAVLEFQKELDEEKENSKMYQEYWLQVDKKCAMMKDKLKILGDLIRTWE